MKQEQAARPLYAKRAALYIRVSTDEQARHGFSLGEQQIDLKNYAENKGFHVVGLYGDEGCSARKAISRRHELQRLLHDVEQGRVDIVVAKSLDRLTRNVRDFYHLKDTFDAHGVDMAFSREPDYNTTTTSGRLMLNLRLAIAQNESDTTGDRIKFVFEGKRRNKEYYGGALPYGYKREGKQITIDEERAEVVRFSFQHVIEGNSVFSLLDAVPSRFGVHFTRDRASYILRNKTYYGEHYDTPDYFPPIVTKETFDKAQDILSRHPRKASEGVYLFSGLIRCPCCGRTLIGHRKTATQKCYYCGGRVKHERAERCKYSSALGERRLEKWLLEHVADLLKNAFAEVLPPKKKKESQLATIRAKMERLTETYIEGAYSKNEYHKRLDALKAKEREAIAAEMQDTNERNKKRREVPAMLRGDKFPAIYEGWTREKKRAFWQGLIKSITFENKPLKRSTPLDFRVSFFD